MDSDIGVHCAYLYCISKHLEQLLAMPYRLRCGCPGGFLPVKSDFVACDIRLRSFSDFTDLPSEIS